jgi:endonuclease YncB( thermonuclease family)
MKRIVASSVLALLAATLPSATLAADAVKRRVSRPSPPIESGSNRVRSTVDGRVSVIDGRTLWFPERAQSIRLAGIDSCELPQWSFDPLRHAGSPFAKPVPCGAIAKAWLKRSLANSRVRCTVTSQAADRTFAGRCIVKGRDLAIEMLRAGWARVGGPSPHDPGYLTWQRHAMAARYGMWGTYILDMDEWRAKAVDRTLARRPIADFKLLAQRERGISPPFQDARNHPVATDRCGAILPC